MAKCDNSLENDHIDEVAILSNGWTLHSLLLVICGISTAIAVVASIALMWGHALHYSVPSQQRHIIRILFMVPIYSVVSFLSLYYYRKVVYFQVLRDCYEAFAIASFFSLLCSYVADNLHDQKDYFRQSTPKPWLWPLTWFKKARCLGGEKAWRTPRSGLTFFNIMWVGIFQYCFIRTAMTITAVVTEVFRRYCTESLNPAFAHIWVMIVQSTAVTIAMYCLIQFYYQLKDNIAEHRPLLKIVSIKLVIFLSFWQEIVLSFLTSAGAIKASKKFAEQDIKVGITSTLLTVEMALFSLLHIFAFPYKPYILKGLDTKQAYQGGWGGIMAGVDSFNPWDFVKAVARGFRWLFVGVRHREADSSYQQQVHHLRADSVFSARSGSGHSGSDTENPEVPLAGAGSPPAGHPVAPLHYDPYANNNYDIYGGYGGANNKPGYV